jgi:hypothetical protein
MPPPGLPRGMIYLSLAIGFEEDRKRLGLFAAVDRLLDALAYNGLTLDGDERMFAGVMASGISEVGTLRCREDVDGRSTAHAAALTPQHFVRPWVLKAARYFSAAVICFAQTVAIAQSLAPELQEDGLPHIPRITRIGGAYSSIACDGQGTCASVGIDGIAMKSGDGPWQRAEEDTSGGWKAVAHGGTTWVAVGPGGIAVKEGNQPWVFNQSWAPTPDHASLVGQWNNVAFDGKSTWTVVGGSGIAVREGNQPWYFPPLSTKKQSFNAVASGGKSIWVAVGTGIAMKDGAGPWKIVDGMSDLVKAGPSWRAVAHDGRSCWVAVGAAGIAMKIGNAPWKRVQDSVGRHYDAIAFDGRTTWVAAGGSGIATRSNDGPWVQPDSDFRPRSAALAFDGQSTWIAVGMEGVRMKTSGGPWVVVDDQDRGSWTAVAFDGRSTWSAVGGRGILMKEGNRPWRLLSDQEGGPWNIPGAPWNDVATDGRGTWVAIGPPGIATKAGDKPWVLRPITGPSPFEQPLVLGQAPRPLPSERPRVLSQGPVFWSAVTYDGKSTWVAVGSLIAMKSGDGDWQNQPVRMPTSFPGAWYDVAYDGHSTWAAVGPWGIAMKVADEPWRIAKETATGIQPFTFGAALPRPSKRIASDGKSTWVALATAGIVMKTRQSPWQLVTGTGLDQKFDALAFDGSSTWVAVGDGIESSTGGIIEGIVATKVGEKPWRRVELTLPFSWNRVMYLQDAHIWMATGEDQTAGFSFDGETWFYSFQILPYLYDRSTFLVNDVSGTFIGSTLIQVKEATRPLRVMTVRSTPDYFQDNGRLSQVGRGPALPVITAAKFDTVSVSEAQVAFSVDGPATTCGTRPITATVYAQRDHSIRFDVANLQKVGEATISTESLTRPIKVPLILSGDAGVGAVTGDRLAYFIGLRCGNWVTRYPRHALLGYFDFRPWYEESWAVGSKWTLLTFFLFALSASVLYAFKPLWLLKVYQSTGLGAVGSFEVPQTPFKLADAFNFFNAFVIPLLVRQPRTLNAWAASRAKRWSEAFNSEETARLNTGYVPLPCRVGKAEQGELLQQPDAVAILAGASVEERLVIEISGSGGAGKTMLLIQTCRWLLDGAPAHTPEAVRLPVLIEEDTTDLLAVLKRKINATLGEEVDRNFLKVLLKAGKLVPVFDRLSERDPKTIAYVEKLQGEAPTQLTLVSTRRNFSYEGASVRRIFPRPLDPASMTSLLGALLAAPEAQRVFGQVKDIEELTPRLRKMIQYKGEDLPLTPLVVRLFVDRAVRLATDGRTLDELPTSVPQAYFAYLCDINPKASDSEHFLTDDEMLQAARGLAELSLGTGFVPRHFEVEAALRALRERGVDAPRDAIESLKRSGVLVESRPGARYLLRFALDPVAEYLAAEEYLAPTGVDSAEREEVFSKVRAAGDPAKGFLVALEQVRQLHDRDH